MQKNNFLRLKSNGLIKIFHDLSDLSELYQSQIELLDPILDEELLLHKAKQKLEADRQRLSIARKLKQMGVDIAECARGAA